MLKTKKKPTKKAAPKLIAVIKNGHTEAELDEMEERWVNHQGPYMTLQQVIAIEAAKQQKWVQTSRLFRCAEQKPPDTLD